MFGNTLGWCISAAIASVIGLLFYFTGVPPRISEPSGKMTYGLQPIAPLTNLATLAPYGTKDADAADSYRAAAAKRKDDRREFDKFLHSKAKLADLPPIEPTLELLVAGAECSHMNLFAKKPSEVVNYDNERPILENLKTLGAEAVSASGPVEKSDAAKAKRWMEGALVLGRHLFEERQDFDEYSIGLGLISNAATMLSAYEERHGGSARVGQLKQLATEARGQLQKAEPLWTAISGIERLNQPLDYPGDMFDIAKNSKEPMWQAEALLKLGRMQHMGSVTYGDQRGAARLLKSMAERTDLPPNVKAAAVAGRDLTVEDFRKIG